MGVSCTRRRPHQRRGPHSALERHGVASGVGRRVDLSQPPRPHPGDRSRRKGALAVPLSPGLDGNHNRNEVRRCGLLRLSVAPTSSTGGTRSRRRENEPQHGVGFGGPTHRPLQHPSGFRRVRQSERILRIDNAEIHARQARPRRRRRRATRRRLFLHRQIGKELGHHH